MSNAQGIHRRLDFTVTDALVRRFWSRVSVSQTPDACWLWNAAYRNGYGAIKHESKVVSAHRLAYVIAFGFPDDDKVVAHTCDNKGCCNPKHLEAITPKQNNADAKDRIRFHFNAGEDVPNARLTWTIVDEIRRIHGDDGSSPRKIIDRLQLTVDRRTVEKVLKFETWKPENRNLNLKDGK
jgi:hypothetical protein